MPKRPLRSISGVPKRETDPVLQRQALHDAVPALAALFTLRSKRMNPFVRRDRAAAATRKNGSIRPSRAIGAATRTTPTTKRILRATSWCSAAAAAQRHAVAPGRKNETSKKYSNSSAETAAPPRPKKTHATKQYKNTGRDARARRPHRTDLQRRLLGDGRDAVAVHDRDSPREP